MEEKGDTVLPGFGSLTGGFVMSPEPRECVYAMEDRDVAGFCPGVAE